MARNKNIGKLVVFEKEGLMLGIITAVKENNSSGLPKRVYYIEWLNQRRGGHSARSGDWYFSDSIVYFLGLFNKFKKTI